MRWLIFALGVALALGGAASIVSGVPYIRIEFGWTEVIAGTTALSAGIVTVALGAVLGALRRLEARFAGGRRHARIRTSRSDGEQLPRSRRIRSAMGPNRGPRTRRPRSVRRGTRHPSVAGLAAARGAYLVEAEHPWSRPTREGRSIGPGRAVRSPDRSARRPNSRFRRRAGSRRETPARPRQLGVAAPRSYGRPCRRHRPAATPTTAYPLSFRRLNLPSPEQAAPEAPTVVGRYESGGASYVLFSDGTIEVETEVGLHRFGSMEELKAYIDQQQTSATS